MRLLNLTLLAAFGAALIPITAAAKPRAADRCAALEGRDLVRGKDVRAVRRGSHLYFCVEGGKLRRLDGSPVVRRSAGSLLFVHRRGTALVLDSQTGRRAILGPVRQLVQTEIDKEAGVIAVRRTAAGDALIVAAPGRALHVIDQGTAPIQEVTTGDGGVTFKRDGVLQRAVLPNRDYRCRDLLGVDMLDGPGRIGRFEVGGMLAYHLGCTGAPDAPTFPLDGRLPVATAGSWILLSISGGDPSDRYRADYFQTWSLMDLATGRKRELAFVTGYTPSQQSGRSLRQHVLLADGRIVAIIDEWRNGHHLASTVIVNDPRGSEIFLGSDCREVANLRVEGDVARWTVGGEERSAPLAGAEIA